MSAAIAGTATGGGSVSMDGVLRALVSPDEFKRVAGELQAVADRAKAEAEIAAAKVVAANEAVATAEQTVANLMAEADAKLAAAAKDAEEILSVSKTQAEEMLSEARSAVADLKAEVELLTGLRASEQAAINEARQAFDAERDADKAELAALVADVERREHDATETVSAALAARDAALAKVAALRAALEG